MHITRTIIDPRITRVRILNKEGQVLAQDPLMAIRILHHQFFFIHSKQAPVTPAGCMGRCPGPLICICNLPTMTVHYALHTGVVSHWLGAVALIHYCMYIGLAEISGI